MKVIGTTAGGFLVEATEIELANVCGVSYASRAPWANSSTNIRASGKLEVGTEIPVSAIFQRLGALEAGEQQVKSGAAAMRALADLAEKSLPSAVLPPKPQVPPEGGGL